MKKIFTILVAVFSAHLLQANNIQVSNINVSQPNISFTISWENSWNTTNNINPLYPNNWDGAWVFIKYQNNIDNLWKHATVSSINTDHTISGGILQIESVADGMGIFIRRSNPGSGTVTASVTLKMNALTGAGNFNFKVFGTEVVNIPQSNFQLGDGNVGGANYFTVQDITAAKQTAGVAAGALYSGSPALPAAFPMGYNAFYLMKYEVTMEQWVDFLNTLTYDQQATRIDAAPNSVVNSFAYANNPNTNNDNIIKIQSPGLNNTMPATFGCDYDLDNVMNENTDGQNIAFALGSKADYYAFLDWSGLRPMTELEYEKACRGTQPRVTNEFAWGSTTHIPRVRTAFTNPGQDNEQFVGTVVNGQMVATGGNSSVYGPGRVGVFATNSSGRASAGAGFYGNMELSGNCWEVCIAADALGAAFTNVNGNGTLTTPGESDVAGWPSNVVAASGTTVRGGSWFEQTSYTVYTSTSFRPGSIAAGRNTVNGVRGARMAP